MTKECMCGMATSKMQWNLKDIKMNLTIAKEFGKDKLEVTLHKGIYLPQIEDIERTSEKAVIHCEIPKDFIDRVKERTSYMTNIIKKKRHTRADIMEMENELIYLEDSLDTHLKGCVKKP